VILYIQKRNSRVNQTRVEGLGNNQDFPCQVFLDREMREGVREAK
jgi:hypothetical protein